MPQIDYYNFYIINIMSVDTFVKFNSVLLYTYAKSAALRKVAYFTDSCALTVANGV